jgi:hypothetical protein
MRRHWMGSGIFILMVILGVGGCSKFAPVEGVVLLDGEPLAGVTVMFVPTETLPGRGGPRQANALTNSEGHFRLETVNKIGAIPATYKVMVSKKVLPPGEKPPTPGNMGEMMAASAKMKESLPKIYTQQSSTPLVWEITPKGVKDAEIKLESKPGQGG